MTVSHRPPINEELLSAYLDNEVTDEERSLVETAIATDPAIAWQVESLRQTIHLLQELPALVLPRTFTLEAVIADAKRQEAFSPSVQNSVQGIGKKPAMAKQVSKEEQASDWWQWFQQIWQGGNLQLRNGAALAFTLMFVLLVSNRFVAPYQPTGSQARAPSITQTTANGTGSENSTANSASTQETAQLEITPILEPTGRALATQPPVAAAVQEQPGQTAAAKQGPVQDETATAASTAVTQRSFAQAPGPDDENLTGDSATDATQSDQSAGAADIGQGNERMAATESFVQAASPSPSVTLAFSTTITENYNTENQTTTVSTLTPTATVTVTERVILETITPSVSQSIAITTRTEHLATPETELIGMANATTNADDANRWLGWAQMLTAVCAVVLGGLWWRSRE